MYLLGKLNLRLEDELIEMEMERSADVSTIDIEDPLGSDSKELEDTVDQGIIAHECLDILETLKSEKLDNNYIKNSIIYTCGRLGMNYQSVMTDIKTEDFNLHTESVVKNFITKILEVIKKIWDSIKMFFTKVWIKIQTKYYKFTQNIFNLRKKAYGIRNKSDICLTSEDAKYIIDTLSLFIYITNVDLKNNPLTAITKGSEVLKKYCSGKEIGIRLQLFKDLTEQLEKGAKIVTETNNDENALKEFEDATCKVLEKFANNSGLVIKNATIRYKGGEGNIKSAGCDCIPISISLDKDVYVNKIGPGISRTISDERDGVAVLSNNFGIGSIFIDNPTVFGSESRMTGFSITKINYETLALLAESVDSLKQFVDAIQKVVFNTDNVLQKIIKKLSSSNESNKTKQIIYLLARGLSMCIFKYIKDMIKLIQAISKIINKMYKAAQSSTNLGVLDYFKKIQEKQITEITVPGAPVAFKVEDPSKWKLVENKDMCYIVPDKSFWDQLKESANLVGGVAFTAVVQKEVYEQMGINNIDDDMLKTNAAEIKDLGSDKNASDAIKAEKTALDAYQIGIIFLDEDYTNNFTIKSLFDITGNMNFIYYHELGHLLTGQHETLLKYTGPNDLVNDIRDGFMEYAVRNVENKADAYACLKCGVSPEKIVQKRKDLALGLADDHFNGRDNVPRGYLEKVDKYADIMVKNIKKEIGNMRSIASLTPYEYLVSKFTEMRN